MIKDIWVCRFTSMNNNHIDELAAHDTPIHHVYTDFRTDILRDHLHIKWCIVADAAVGHVNAVRSLVPDE